MKIYSPRMLESNLDLCHDITRRTVEELPEGQPIGVQRAMQRIITEQIGMFCTGVSPGEYSDDLACFLAMVIQLDVTKRLPKARWGACPGTVAPGGVWDNSTSG